MILVINNNEVQNRIVQVDAKYTRSELEVAANYLTQRYRGQELSTIREKLLQADMRADQENMQWAAEAVINLAEQTCNKDKKEDFVISGESNLIDIAQESGLAKLRELFDAFTPQTGNFAFIRPKHPCRWDTNFYRRRVWHCGDGPM